MTKRASFAAPTSRQERFVRSTNHDRIALGSQSVQPVLDNKGGGSAMKSNSVSRAVDEFATGSADSLILIGRVLLAWVFVGSAYGAISDFSGSVGYFRSLHLPAPELFTMTNIALEVLISVVFDIGRRHALLCNSDVCVRRGGNGYRAPLLGVSRGRAADWSIQPFPEEHLDHGRRDVDLRHRGRPVQFRSGIVADITSSWA
ncbi:hypothetical protein ACVIJX_004241 [Bradyrhizobium diazoefficiens]